MSGKQKPAYANAAWYKALAAEVARTSQAAVARRLRVSESSISQLLSGKYPSNPTNMIKRIEGELLHKTVKCPVLGTITTHRCMAEQDRPFAATNPQRVATYKACRSGCPHSKHGRKS